MRAVVDTNVLVAALFTPTGTCARVLDLMVEGVLHPCVDPRILAEYEEVLRDPRMPFEPHQADAVLELMHSAGEPVTARPLAAALPHEDDRPFLEAADAAQAILVTGNPRHFPKRARGSVRVLSPAELLEALRRRD